MRFLVVNFALLLLLSRLSAWAQTSTTLSGQVRDARTQQPLPYASVFLANTTLGTTTDSTGRFVLGAFRGGNMK